MNAPARFHLPLVAHVEITAPTDRVRCPTFSADLTAAACADRTLALKLKPGHRRSGRVMTGVARYATCAGCPLGAEARARLAVKGQPGRVAHISLRHISGEEPHAPAEKPATLTPTAVETLSLFGWSRDGATWIDPHGTRFGETAAAVIAHRERALVAMDPASRAGLSGPPCATPGCSGRVRGAQAKTLAVLVDRCPACRQYGNLALRRGTVTPETIVAWLERLAARKAAA